MANRLNPPENRGRADRAEMDSEQGFRPAIRELAEYENPQNENFKFIIDKTKRSQ